MVSSEVARLQRRARWAYEWGRLRAAVPGALPAVGLTLMAAMVGTRSTLPLGSALVLLCLGLGWRGMHWGRAVMPGLLAGLIPLLGPCVVYVAGHICFGSSCRSFCFASCVIGGLIAGALLSREALRMEQGRVGFILASGTVASLCGSLACILYGLSGVLGLVAGLALVSTPVLILRRA